MKSIKKRNNSFWMIGSFLIVLIVFLLLLSKTPQKMIEDTVDYREMITLIKALDTKENETKYDVFFTEYIENGDGITYEELKKILDVLDSSGNTSARFLDNVSFKKEIERDAFYNIYDKLIVNYNKQNEIFLEEIAILGLADEYMENQQLLITTNEIGYCDPILFEPFSGFVTKTYVQRSLQEVEYLAVKDTVGEKINVSYVYVTGQDVEGIHFLIKDMEMVLEPEKNVTVENDVIANLTIENGKVSKVESFSEKINDKVLSINNTSVRLEKFGVYEFVDDMKVYKIYDGLKEGSIADVALGYEFVDFVVKDGKVCACLIVANDEMEYIRVLIKSNGFASNYHDEVTISCDSDYKIYDSKNEYLEYKAFENVTFTKGDLNENELVKIVPDVLSGKVIISSLTRNQGIPDYSGVIELHKKNEGIVVINEVLLEEYLYTVVPSEMPSYYAEQALMAQAICARTYAFTKMLNAGLKDLGAHLDDSTSFQVYNNIEEQVSTTNAVRKTVGMIVTVDNEPLETMYYSTSFGMGSSGNRINKLEKDTMDLSANEDFDEYIENTYETDFEFLEGLYRWSYDTNLNMKLLESRVQECYNKNKSNVLYLGNDNQFTTKEEFAQLGQIQEIFVVERSIGGRAEKVSIQGSLNTILLCGEYNIRYSLLNEEKGISRQDGTVMNMTTLLPSAFFKIETGKADDSVIGYSVIGGGFGHGNGMSQNGAGNMAKEGYTYDEILSVFYDNCVVDLIY